MRDNVVEEMRRMQSDDETKRKMVDILKRFHSEEEMDSVDEDGMLLFSSLLIFSLINTCIKSCWFCSLCICYHC